MTLIDIALDATIAFGLAYLTFGLAVHLVYRWHHPFEAEHAEALPAATKMQTPIAALPTAKGLKLTEAATPADSNAVDAGDRPPRRVLLAQAKELRVPYYSTLNTDTLAVAVQAARLGYAVQLP